MASFYMRQGRYEEAVPLYKTVHTRIKAPPGTKLSAVNYATSLQATSKFEEATSVLKNFLGSGDAIDRSARADVNAKLGIIALQTGDRATARRLLQGAVNVDETHDGARTLVMLAQTLADDGDFAEAKQLAERALELNPGDHAMVRPNWELVMQKVKQAQSNQKAHQ